MIIYSSHYCVLATSKRGSGRSGRYCWCDSRLRGHKSETVSLLISISVSVKEYIEEKWDWDQKWDRLAFMAPEPACLLTLTLFKNLKLKAYLKSNNLFPFLKMQRVGGETHHPTRLPRSANVRTLIVHWSNPSNITTIRIHVLYYSKHSKLFKHKLVF